MLASPEDVASPENVALLHAAGFALVGRLGSCKRASFLRFGSLHPLNDTIFLDAPQLKTNRIALSKKAGLSKGILASFITYSPIKLFVRLGPGKKYIPQGKKNGV